MENFSNRLKEERKRQNMTQQDLADQLHVSRTSISNWEVGRNYPDLEVLVRLSEVLNLSLDHLLKEDIDMVEDYSQKIKTSKKKSAIIKVLAGILIGLFVVTGLSLKLFVVGWDVESKNVHIDYAKTPDNNATLRIGSKNNRRVELVKNGSDEMRVVEKFEPFFIKRPQKFSYYSIHSTTEQFQQLKFKDRKVSINWTIINNADKQYHYQKYPL